VTPKEIRFAIIEELREFHSLQWLIEFAQVSRAGYYKWKNSREKQKKRSGEEQFVKERILAIHRLHPYFGYLRMTVALRKEGLSINHKRVYRLMKELGIRSVIRKKRRFFGKRRSVVQPNRLKREFHAGKPYEKLVTDITYIQAGEQCYYLSVIQDLYNNEIVAWEISEENNLDLVLKTVDQLPLTKLTGTILHSDQGLQYTSKTYNKRLEQFGLLGSHSRSGNCLDNACIESFFSHLKTEKIYLHSPSCKEELTQCVEEYIFFYNHNRFQKKLSDRSPVEYREEVAA
jgi:transposase InsO family protein